MEKRQSIRLTGLAGLKLHAGDGLEEQGFPEMMSTPLFYFAQAGDRVKLLDAAYKYNVATYLPEIEPRWIYTYDYAPNESWTVYRRDLSGDSYRQDDYVFSEPVYFRICLRKLDGSIFDGTEDIGGILSFEAACQARRTENKWMTTEINRVTEQVCALRTDDDLVFAALTDSHYTVNGTWDDTIESIRQTHEAVNFDGIIHLGDFTDGMVTGEVTRSYVSNILSGLKSCGVPIWAAIGNHDSNYFRGNRDRFTLQEQSALYLGLNEPRYYVDFENLKMRFIFLDSFDPDEELRYGYSRECIDWLGKTLEDTPKAWRTILYSHLPPVARLQYWAKALRGEDEIVRLLTIHSNKILAWINGHNHADRLDNGEAVPIVSIANAKCEAFTEYKTTGFITPARKLGEASQELWDIMLINPEKRTLRFVRFGSGQDRIIANGKAEWL